MSKVKLKFINQSGWQLFLAGSAALFLFAPSAQSLQPSSSESKSENKLGNIADASQVGLPSANSSNKKVIEVAQAFNAVCPPNTEVYRSGETKNYLVQICASESGNLTFVGITKNDRANRLVGSIPSNSGQQFVVVSGSSRYILTRKDLRIIQNGKTFTEPVLQWYEKIQLKP